VLDGLEGRKGLGADPLGWGIGCDEMRVLLFQGANLSHERVVLAIGNDGVVKDVIAVVVKIESALEFGVALIRG
jgi:hypothetical protein